MHYTSPGFVFLVVAVVWLAVGVVTKDRSPRWHWYTTGYPLTWARISWSWRPLCIERGLAISRTAGRVRIGDMMVQGQDLRPVVPRFWIGRPTPTGLTVRVRLLPGQTPELYAQASEALMHAWRVHGVRVLSKSRGTVAIEVFTSDPLAGVIMLDPAHDPVLAEGPADRPVLALLAGVTERGTSFIVNLRLLPHWLIVGATRSGKSTLVHAIVSRLAPQYVILLGIDLKFGMELSVYAPRLSGLAITRREAVDMLSGLLDRAFERMEACRREGVRAAWELKDPPPPVVVLVDEIAELYLVTNPRDREEIALRDQAATLLLRLAQLGAAVDIHLIISGQRFGADLGQGATALRAQLGGRICLHVNDPESAVMVLGDIWPTAVAVAQMISVEQRGTLVAADGNGGWVRARAMFVDASDAADIARRTARLTPVLEGIALPEYAGAGGGDAR
ncbi:MAG TPA: FtsK/SpoIIIE domain-containing protein [Actinospica sp.]|nr:FtsK/SpoIIIE domain-containing protein [Actinospica sp.]